jgi:hypothetical protein
VYFCVYCVSEILELVLLTDDQLLLVSRDDILIVFLLDRLLPPRLGCGFKLSNLLVDIALRNILCR